MVGDKESSTWRGSLESNIHASGRVGAWESGRVGGGLEIVEYLRNSVGESVRSRITHCEAS